MSNKKPFKKTHDIGGTSLQGVLRVPYRDIVAVFGYPHCSGDGYKTDAEWAVKFPDGCVATIYNWKDGANYLGLRDGLHPSAIKLWHVGGHTPEALHRVQELLDRLPADNKG
jgi:hypothetical protein